MRVVREERLCMPNDYRFQRKPLDDLNPVRIIAAKGDAPMTFFLNERAARKHSQGIAILLHQLSLEENERRTRLKIRLPDIDPEYFNIFAWFIETGSIYSRFKGERPGTASDDEYGRLGQCWLLGHWLQSPSLQDAVCDAIANKDSTETHHPVKMHTLAYGYPCGDTGFKRLTVDIALWCWKKKEPTKQDAKKYPQFAIDLKKRKAEFEGKDKGKAPYRQPSCYYHEHVPGNSPCYKTMNFP